MIKNIVLALQFALIVVLILLLIWTNKRIFYKLSGFFRIGILSYKNKNTFPGRMAAYADHMNEYIKNDIYEHIQDVLLREILVSACSGKKIRPGIVISVYELLADVTLQDIPKYVFSAAASIEYIHCASLIIDDIMDGDETRRGKPSIYAKFGTDIAQLAALILFTFAIRSYNTSLEMLLRENPNKESTINLVSFANEFFTKTITELCIGQYYDIIAQTVDIFELMDKKTGCLYELSFLIPFILSAENLEDSKTAEICTIGRTFGQIFQLCDDFEDIEKDRDNGRPNYVVKVGYKKARAEYMKLSDKFRADCEEQKIWNNYLEDVLGYICPGGPTV